MGPKVSSRTWRAGTQGQGLLGSPKVARDFHPYSKGQSSISRGRVMYPIVPARPLEEPGWRGQEVELAGTALQEAGCLCLCPGGTWLLIP